MRESAKTPTFTLLILGAALGIACGTAVPPAAEPGAGGDPADETADREAVVAAHRALVSAYEAGDVDAFVAVLEPTAQLLIFHPAVRGRFDGVDRVRREMGAMFSRVRGADWTDHHALVTLDGDVAWLTAQILIESPSLESPFVGRGTEIFVRRPGGWKLAHGHWSAVPEDWSAEPGVQE